MVQLLSGPLLDDLAAAYALTVENFEKLAHSVFSELGARALQLDPSSTVDTSSSAATTGPSLFFSSLSLFHLPLLELLVSSLPAVLI